MSHRTVLKIHKGDKVRVISGDSKGVEGEVLVVDAANNRVTVKGANIVTRHRKPTAMNPEGGIEKFEAPLNASKVMLVDPKSGKPTRIGIKRDGNKKLRVAKKSGEVIKK